MTYTGTKVKSLRVKFVKKTKLQKGDRSRPCILTANPFVIGSIRETVIGT